MKIRFCPPTTALAAAEIVSTLLPVAGLVPNDALMPQQRLVAPKVTLPVKPLRGFTIIVSLTVPPWVTLRLTLAALRLNVGDVVTV